jgi:hypothetical protein
MTEAKSLTAEERAEMAAHVRAHFGDRYEDVCRAAYARTKIARAHRLAAERGDWSWKPEVSR